MYPPYHTRSPKLRLAVAAFAACTITGAASAQFDLQGAQLYGIHRTYANPAALQDHHVTIGLPSVGVGAYSSVSLGDVATVEGSVLRVDPDLALAEFGGAEQHVRAAVDVETFGLTIRKGATQVGFGHRVRARAAAVVPRRLAELLLEGNAAFLGERVAIAPLVRGQAWQEYYAHFAFPVGERFGFGAAVKYLRGSAFAQLDGPGLGVFTEEDTYALRTDLDAAVQTAGIEVNLNEEGDLLPDYDPGNFAEALPPGGNGFGVDLGATYRAADRLQVGLAVRDIGLIRWGASARDARYVGEYTYRGFTGNLFGEDDGPEVGFDAFLDSVRLSADEELGADAFTTWQLPSVRATARYRLARYTTASATALAEARPGGWTAGVGIGLAQRFWELGQLGLTGGFANGGPYLGGNLMIDLMGPQVYVAVDNALVGDNFLLTRGTYVRAGLTLAFAKVKRGDKRRGWYDRTWATKRETRRAAAPADSARADAPHVPGTPLDSLGLDSLGLDSLGLDSARVDERGDPDATGAGRRDGSRAAPAHPDRGERRAPLPDRRAPEPRKPPRSALPDRSPRP